MKKGRSQKDWGGGGRRKDADRRGEKGKKLNVGRREGRGRRTEKGG